MSYKLTEWIIEEKENRGWSIRKLAARAELAPSTVSDILGHRTNPGLEFCTGIARAFGVPAENVLRLAGLIPPKPEGSAALDELVHVASRLADDELERLTGIARYFYEQVQKQRQGEKVPRRSGS